MREFKEKIKDVPDNHEVVFTNENNTFVYRDIIHFRVDDLVVIKLERVTQ